MEGERWQLKNNQMCLFAFLLLFDFLQVKGSNDDFDSSIVIRLNICLTSV